MQCKQPSPKLKSEQIVAVLCGGFTANTKLLHGKQFGGGPRSRKRKIWRQIAKWHATRSFKMWAVFKMWAIFKMRAWGVQTKKTFSDWWWFFLYTFAVCVYYFQRFATCLPVDLQTGAFLEFRLIVGLIYD